MAPTASTGGDELLQAEAKLWCYAMGYIKSMALQCAITLGIPSAIHERGGEASLSELHAAVPVAAGKRPCLSRLMRFLATTGIFVEVTPVVGGDAADPRYRLNAASRLLAGGGDAAGSSSSSACLAQLMLLMAAPLYVAASQSMAGWLKEDNGAAAAAETPFAAAYGERVYDFLNHDAALSECFDEAMASDSGFLSEMVVRECGEVFAGATSLVDVGGHDGTTARAIAKAFPHVRCSVLELARVVDAMPDDGTVEFVAGDMMEFIPPADVVLFKFMLHNWSDEDCVKTLKRAKQAVSSREPKGKVVIIDVVIGSPSKQQLEAQLCLDLLMMVVTTGKQREEKAWHRIFMEAGFTRYEVRRVLGSRSLIEVYP